MPSRVVFGTIFAIWLLVMAWFVVDRWLPWWRPSDRAPFAVDLADEVASEHGSWVLQRQGKKAGTVDTRMAPKKEGVFEFSARIREVDLTMGAVSAKVPVLQTVRFLDRDGSLRSLTAQANVHIKALNVDRKVRCTIQATVDQGTLTTTIEVEGSPASTTVVGMATRSALVALQPWNKYPVLHAGQTWRETFVDPLSTMLELAGQAVLRDELGMSMPRVDRPQELLAQVQSSRESITLKDEVVECWVIVHKGRDEVARTWVDANTGRVVRHQCEIAGEKMTIQRD